MTTPYCTVDDVQSLIPWELKDTNPTGNPSIITQADVTDDIIPEMSRYIDDRLGQYYFTPITGANALVTINRVARYLSAAEVVTRKYTGETPGNSSQATTYRTMAESDLTRIIGGDIILYDAQATADTPESRAHQISDNLSSPLATPAYFSTGKVF